MPISESVLIQGIISVQLIIVAVVGVFGSIIVAKINNVKKDAKAARDQVENDNTTNMRVENDSRHEETRKWFTALFRRTVRIDRRLEKLELDVSDLATGFLENRERIETIEEEQNGE